MATWIMDMNSQYHRTAECDLQGLKLLLMISISLLKV